MTETFLPLTCVYMRRFVLLATCGTTVAFLAVTAEFYAMAFVAMCVA